MPPHPYEFHFATPPCSPKRRGSPQSCDTDSPLCLPPSVSRNPGLFSASSFSTGELSEDAGDVDQSRSSPSEERSGAIRGRSPNKSLIQKRRRRFVEHRRARSRSIDKVNIGGATKSQSSPESAATISKDSQSCIVAGPSSNADSLNNVFVEKYSDGASVYDVTACKSSPMSSNADIKPKNIPSLKTTTLVGDRSISSTTHATTPSSIRSTITLSPRFTPSIQDYHDMEAELASLRTYQNNTVHAMKDYEDTVQALEKTATERDGEIEELKKQLNEEAKNYSKAIKSKNKEIKELEDMVIWSETTLATQLDEAQESVKMKDEEIIKLKSELLSIGTLNDTKSMEIEEAARHRTHVESMLQAKSIECTNLQKQLDEHVNDYEATISEMKDTAQEVKSYLEKISQLESELSIKTKEISNYKGHLAELSSNVQSQKAKISELCKQNDDKDNKHEHTICAMAKNSAKEVETYTEQISTLETELDEVRKELVRKDDKINKLEQSITEMKESRENENSAQIAQISEQEKPIHELNSQIRSLQIDEGSKIEEGTYQVSQHTQIKDLEVQNLDLHNKNVSLEQSLNCKDNKIRELQFELATANDKIEGLNIMLLECKEDFKTEREKLVERTRHLDLRLYQREMEISQHAESMINLSTSVTGMESKIVSLHSINDALVIEKDEFRQQHLDIKDDIKVNTQQQGAEYQEFDEKHEIEETIEKDMEIELLKDAINNLQQKTQDESQDSTYVARVNSLVEGKKSGESKIDLADEQIKTLLLTNTELEKEMKRKDRKLKAAQEVIAGLEKTLVVSALIDCFCLTSIEIVH